MSLADYLAKNYLTADPVPEKKKKRKRKDKTAESGLVIADDDVLGWTKDTGRGDDEDGPLTGKCHWLFYIVYIARWYPFESEPL